jgi:hypothetical protein
MDDTIFTERKDELEQDIHVQNENGMQSLYGLVCRICSSHFKGSPNKTTVLSPVSVVIHGFTLKQGLEKILRMG